MTLLRSSGMPVLAWLAAVAVARLALLDGEGRRVPRRATGFLCTRDTDQLGTEWANAGHGW